MSKLTKWFYILPLGFLILSSRPFSSSGAKPGSKITTYTTLNKFELGDDGSKSYTKTVSVGGSDNSRKRTRKFKISVSGSMPNPFSKNIEERNNGLIEVSNIYLSIDRSTGQCVMNFDASNKASLYKLETKDVVFYFNLALLSSKQPDKLKDNLFSSPYIAISPNVVGRKKLKFPTNKEKELLGLFDDCKVDLLVVKDSEKLPKSLKLQKIRKSQTIGSTLSESYMFRNRSFRNFVENHQQSLAHLLVLLPILSSFGMVWYVVKRSSCFQKQKPRKVEKKRNPISEAPSFTPLGFK